MHSSANTVSSQVSSQTASCSGAIQWHCHFTAQCFFQSWNQLCHVLRENRRRIFHQLVWRPWSSWRRHCQLWRTVCSFLLRQLLACCFQSWSQWRSCARQCRLLESQDRWAARGVAKVSRRQCLGLWVARAASLRWQAASQVEAVGYHTCINTGKCVGKWRGWCQIRIDAQLLVLTAMLHFVADLVRRWRIVARIHRENNRTMEQGRIMESNVVRARFRVGLQLKLACTVQGPDQWIAVNALHRSPSHSSLPSPYTARPCVSQLRRST